MLPGYEASSVQLWPLSQVEATAQLVCKSSAEHSIALLPGCVDVARLRGSSNAQARPN